MHGTQIVLPRLLCPTTCHPPLEPTAMLLRLGVVEIDDDGEFDLILFTHDERGRRAAASAMRNAVFPRRFSHLGPTRTTSKASVRKYGQYSPR